MILAFKRKIRLIKETKVINLGTVEEETVLKVITKVVKKEKENSASQ